MWSEDIRNVAGISWMRKAENRTKWRAIGEPYIQQWTNTDSWWCNDKLYETLFRYSFKLFYSYNRFIQCKHDSWQHSSKYYSVISTSQYESRWPCVSLHDTNNIIIPLITLKEKTAVRLLLCRLRGPFPKFNYAWVFIQQ